jgi:flagellar basal-body rod protein FlgB
LSIGFDQALGPHAQALALRAQRTEVLARNIANADTPGFLARDMDFQAELARQLGAADSRARAPEAAATHEAHLGFRRSAVMADALKYRQPLMPSFDGNTVDAQTEQAAFAQNNLQFQASLRFLDGKFKSLMTAIKGE